MIHRGTAPVLCRLAIRCRHAGITLVMYRGAGRPAERGGAGRSDLLCKRDGDLYPVGGAQTSPKNRRRRGSVGGWVSPGRSGKKQPRTRSRTLTRYPIRCWTKVRTKSGPTGRPSGLVGSLNDMKSRRSKIRKPREKFRMQRLVAKMVRIGFGTGKKLYRKGCFGLRKGTASQPTPRVSFNCNTRLIIPQQRVKPVLALVQCCVSHPPWPIAHPGPRPPGDNRTGDGAAPVCSQFTDCSLIPAARF